jgi:hypothetical protein
MPRPLRPVVLKALFAVLTLVLTWPAPAPARIIRTAPGGGSTVSLPYHVADAQGNQWMIYQTGYLQLQSNQPLYGQAATIQINGAGVGQRNNQARLDDKTGELVFENMTAN